MNSQDLRLKLANEGNRLNHERAQLQAMTLARREKKSLVEKLDGAVQALQALLQEQSANEEAGRKIAEQLRADEERRAEEEKTFPAESKQEIPSPRAR